LHASSVARLQLETNRTHGSAASVKLNATDPASAPAINIGDDRQTRGLHAMLHAQRVQQDLGIPEGACGQIVERLAMQPLALITPLKSFP
jgi:hypothetical protein